MFTDKKKYKIYFYETGEKSPVLTASQVRESLGKQFDEGETLYNCRGEKVRIDAHIKKESIYNSVIDNN